MRIENAGLSAVPKSTASPEQADRRTGPDHVPSASVDSVSLSPQGQLLAIAKRAFAETPAVRAHMVARARERLETGEYEANGRLIAEAIIEALREDQ